MNKSKSTLSWFEIPARDLARATKFYEQVLATSLQRVTSGQGRDVAVFPYEAPGLGGAIVPSDRKPSTDGALVYLDADGKLDDCLRRAQAAGGEVIVPRTSIGVHGFFATIRDTEGNVVGLHEECRA
jgi:predicted enzyme related to lactoylglutathione lyase